MKYTRFPIVFTLALGQVLFLTGQSVFAARSSLPVFYSFKAAYMAGNKALQEGHFEKAAKDYQAAESVASSAKDRCDAYNAQGWALVKDKKWPEAKKAFMAAVAEDNTSALALKNLGYVCFNLYEYGFSGIEELKNAIQYLGESGEDEDLLEWAKGDLNREESYAQATPSPEPNWKAQSFKELLAIGDEAQANGQYNLAIHAFKRAALDAHSKSLKALAANRLGKVFLDDRKALVALPYFQAAVKTKPEQKIYWNNLAYSYWIVYDSGKGSQEDLKKAVDAYYHVNSLDPTFNTEMFQMVLKELNDVNPAAASEYMPSSHSEGTSADTDEDNNQEP